MININKLKSLLGIENTDSTKDNILLFIMDDVNETILNYCNITELPQGLEHTALRMAVDLYRGEDFGNEDSPTSISSLDEGDTKVQFKNSIDENLKDTLLKDYMPQLNRYRRISWH